MASDYHAAADLWTSADNPGVAVPVGVCGDVTASNLVLFVGDATKRLDSGEVIADRLGGQACVIVTDVPDTGDDVAVLTGAALHNGSATKVVLLDPDDRVSHTLRRLFADRVYDRNRKVAESGAGLVEFVVVGSAELAPHQKSKTRNIATAIDCLQAVVTPSDSTGGQAARRAAASSQTDLTSRAKGTVRRRPGSA